MSSATLTLTRPRFKRPRFPNLNSWSTLFKVMFAYMVNAIVRETWQLAHRHSAWDLTNFALQLAIIMVAWHIYARMHDQAKRAEARGPVLPPPWWAWTSVLGVCLFFGILPWFPWWPL